MSSRSWIGVSAIIVAGHIATALIGIAALRVLTELAPKEVFGNTSLVMTLLGLTQHFFVAPFTNTMLRYHTESGSREIQDTAAGQTLGWSLAGSAVAAVLMCAGLAILRPSSLSLGIAGMAASAIWLVASAVKTVLVSRLQAEQRRVGYSAVLVLDAFFIAGMPALALLVEPSSDGYVAGQAAAAVATSLIVTIAVPWPVFRTLQRPRLGTPFVHKVRGYGSAFIPLALLSFFSNLADRYVLAGILGPAVVGQYVGAFSIANRGMALGNTTLTDLFRPALFQAANDAHPEAARRLFTQWVSANIAMSLAALVTISLLGQLIASVLLAESYRDGAVGIMMWITLAYGINGLTQVIENRLLSLHAPRQLLLPLAVGALANLTGSLVLIRANGIVGAAQASCGSFAFQLVVTALLLHSTTREQRQA